MSYERLARRGSHPASCPRSTTVVDRCRHPPSRRSSDVLLLLLLPLPLSSPSSSSSSSPRHRHRSRTTYYLNGRLGRRRGSRGRAPEDGTSSSSSRHRHWSRHRSRHRSRTTYYQNGRLGQRRDSRGRAPEDCTSSSWSRRQADEGSSGRRNHHPSPSCAQLAVACVGSGAWSPPEIVARLLPHHDTLISFSTRFGRARSSEPLLIPHNSNACGLLLNYSFARRKILLFFIAFVRSRREFDSVAGNEKQHIYDRASIVDQYL